MCYDLTDNRSHRKIVQATLALLQQGQPDRARAIVFRRARDIYYRMHGFGLTWEKLVRE